MHTCLDKSHLYKIDSHTCRDSPHSRSIHLHGRRDESHSCETDPHGRRGGTGDDSTHPAEYGATLTTRTALRQAQASAAGVVDGSIVPVLHAAERRLRRALVPAARQSP